jgi:hypothetical protein
MRVPRYSAASGVTLRCGDGALTTAFLQKPQLEQIERLDPVPRLAQRNIYKYLLPAQAPIGDY